jgi:competence protein ComEA
MKLNRVVATLVALALATFFTSAPTLAAGKPAPTAKVNINTASAQQLTTLPGVGEKLAARIIEHRQKSGAFRTTQELMNVKGIGERNFLKLQPHILVGETPARTAVAK